MALILEVIAGRDEVRQRVRLDSFPFTIGRGYASDLILDDPYVDPAHARIVREENGDCYLEDAGSLNGLIAGDQSRAPRILLASGTTARLGRTLLRVRATSDEVAPALADHKAAAFFSLAPLGRRGLAGVIGTGAAVFALTMWLGSYERTSIDDPLTSMLAFLLIGFVWAGCWAIASRVTQHRFHMLEHLAIFAALVTLIMVAGTLTSLLTFFVPFHWLNEAVGAFDAVVGLALLLTAHLGYTSGMSRKRRATIAGSIAVGLVGLALTVSLAKADDYTDVPSFVSTLAPVSARWIPADDPGELERVAAKLKPDVDALKQEK